MKNDRLESFIKDHRDEFDYHAPTDRVWAELDRNLQSKSAKGFNFSILKIAASVIILFGLGIGFGMYLSNQQTNSQLMASSPLYEEYQEAQQYYIQRVNQSWNEIQQYGDHQSVQEDLEQLDVIYEELKAELRNSNNQETDIIVEEMIRNYRTRAELLETVLTRIKSSETTEEESLNDLKSNHHEI